MAKRVCTDLEFLSDPPRTLRSHIVYAYDPRSKLMRNELEVRAKFLLEAQTGKTLSPWRLKSKSLAQEVQQPTLLGPRLILCDAEVLGLGKDADDELMVLSAGRSEDAESHAFVSIPMGRSVIVRLKQNETATTTIVEETTITEMTLRPALVFFMARCNLYDFSLLCNRQEFLSSFDDFIYARPRPLVDLLRRFEDATLTGIDVESNRFHTARQAGRRIAKSGALSLAARISSFLHAPADRWAIMGLVRELDRRQNQLGVRPAVLVTQIYRATAGLIAGKEGRLPPDLAIYWAALLLGWEERLDSGPFPVIFDGLWRALRSGAARLDAARGLDGCWGAIAERVATTVPEPVGGRDQARAQLIETIERHPALQNPAPDTPWLRRLCAILADPRRGSTAAWLGEDWAASSRPRGGIAESPPKRPPAATLPRWASSEPERFDAFLGNDAAVQALTARIASGDTNRHIVFHGPAGTGKSAVAKLYARALRCERVSPSGSACGVCHTCKISAADQDFELRTVDLSRATASAERIINAFANLDDSTRFSSTDARPRVIVVKHAELASPVAADRILKTMERPREAVFVFTTADFGRLRFAIRSRCDVYAIKPLRPSQARARALELCQLAGLRFEPVALAVVAAAASHKAGTLATHLARIAQEGDVTFDRARAALGLTWTDAGLAFWEAALSPDLSNHGASFERPSVEALGGAPEAIARMQAIAHMLEVLASGTKPVADTAVHPALLHLPREAWAHLPERLNACARRRGVDPDALWGDILRFWAACDAREPIGFSSALRTFEEMVTG
jgi:hypothetical protein